MAPVSKRAKWFVTGVIVLLLLVAGTILWTAPRFLVPWLADRAPGCLYSVNTSEPRVALTIDDGPDTATTAGLLHVLRIHQAHATFFLISEHITNDSLIAAVVAQGHEIGNHLTRDQPSIRLSETAFDSSLATAGRRLSAFAPVRWARPGGGRYNQSMLSTMQRQGYACALGSVYPYDAEISSTRFSSAFILAHVRPGSIIVLHDGGSRGHRTRATLERVLPELGRRGLQVVTLSELASPAP
jgi:peptidoglycan/xylan/chitin deacetylase (PgdA/CDA1 family)